MHEITYGDGSKIAKKDLYFILDILDEHTISFPWQSGDMLVMDNVLAMHGRATFQEKRQLLVALSK